MRPCPRCQRPLPAHDAACAGCAGPRPPEAGGLQRLALGSAVVIAASGAAGCPKPQYGMEPRASAAPSAGATQPPSPEPSPMEVHPPYGAATPPAWSPEPAPLAPRPETGPAQPSTPTPKP